MERHYYAVYEPGGDRLGQGDTPEAAMAAAAAWAESDGLCEAGRGREWIDQEIAVGDRTHECRGLHLTEYLVLAVARDSAASASAPCPDAFGRACNGLAIAYGTDPEWARCDECGEVYRVASSWSGA